MFQAVSRSAKLNEPEWLPKLIFKNVGHTCGFATIPGSASPAFLEIYFGKEHELKTRIILAFAAGVSNLMGNHE